MVFLLVKGSAQQEMLGCGNNINTGYALHAFYPPQFIPEFIFYINFVPATGILSSYEKNSVMLIAQNIQLEKMDFFVKHYSHKN